MSYSVVAVADWKGCGVREWQWLWLLMGALVAVAAWKRCGDKHVVPPPNTNHVDLI